MMKPKKQIEAYDYRGHLILLMPSGLALVFAPHILTQGKLPRQLLIEVDGLEKAKAWLDERITPVPAAKAPREPKVKSRSGVLSYRRHLIVPMDSGQITLVYRNRAAGEGRPRINEFHGIDSYDAAIRWIDGRHKNLPAKSGPDSAPEPCVKTPEFVTADLGGGPNIYVIESATRGCFVGMDVRPDRKKAKFRWSIPRSHNDIVRYTTREMAEKAMATVGVRSCYIVALHRNGAR